MVSLKDFTEAVIYEDDLQNQFNPSADKYLMCRYKKSKTRPHMNGVLLTVQSPLIAVDYIGYNEEKKKNEIMRGYIEVSGCRYMLFAFGYLVPEEIFKSNKYVFHECIPNCGRIYFDIDIQKTDVWNTIPNDFCDRFEKVVNKVFNKEGYENPVYCWVKDTIRGKHSYHCVLNYHSGSLSKHMKEIYNRVIKEARDSNMFGFLKNINKLLDMQCAESEWRTLRLCGQRKLMEGKEKIAFRSNKGEEKGSRLMLMNPDKNKLDDSLVYGSYHFYDCVIKRYYPDKEIIGDKFISKPDISNNRRDYSRYALRIDQILNDISMKK